jgi:hypothetical protein
MSHTKHTKPWYKPGKRAKNYLHKGRKAKTRTALAAVVNDSDAAPLPKEPRSDVWN